MNGLISFSMRRIAAMMIMIALLFGVGLFFGIFIENGDDAEH